MTENDQFRQKNYQILKIEHDRDNLELFEFRTSKSLFFVIIPEDYLLIMSWLYLSVIALDSNHVILWKNLYFETYTKQGKYGRSFFLVDFQGPHKISLTLFVESLKTHPDFFRIFSFLGHEPDRITGKSIQKSSNIIFLLNALFWMSVPIKRFRLMAQIFGGCVFQYAPELC